VLSVLRRKSRAAGQLALVKYVWAFYYSSRVGRFGQRENFVFLRFSAAMTFEGFKDLFRGFFHFGERANEEDFDENGERDNPLGAYRSLSCASRLNF
jgi:hypothetical protein